MKKMVASIATGVLLAGASLTTASAAEADYNVEKGDSLWGIAQEHETTIDELVDINDLNTTTIHPNQTLVIEDSDDGESYVIQKGDTLFGISKKFDTSVADLKDWNNLDSDLLTVGQKLDIKGVHIDQNDESEASTDDQSADQSPSDSEGSKVKSEQVSSESQSSDDEQSSSQNKQDGETISVTATAYTADCDNCSGVTATGVDLNDNPDKNVIAVDPDVIPLGSEVYVEGYGQAVAADTGGAINGKKIDVHVPSKGKAEDWGTRDVEVTIID